MENTRTREMLEKVFEGKEKTSTLAELNKYRISGNYKVSGNEEHFDEEVFAPDNEVAMNMVVGGLVRKTDRKFKLMNIHYEVIS